MSKYVGFDVRVFKHLTKEQLLEKLEKEFNDFGDFSQAYDGWFFYFVGHGNEGVIQSRNARMVEIQDIYDKVAERASDNLLKVYRSVYAVQIWGLEVTFR